MIILPTKTVIRIVPIEIISNTVWPRCFVRKSCLESDLSQDAEGNDLVDFFQFDVQWGPRQINVSLLKRWGLDKMGYYVNHFG